MANPKNVAAKKNKPATTPKKVNAATTSNNVDSVKNEKATSSNEAGLLSGASNITAGNLNQNQSGTDPGTNDSGASLENTETKAKLTVVIPYLASAAQGDELKYALRAWEKNFKEDFQIVVIGDKPDFIADHVLHIEALPLMDNPQLDMAAKLMQAIASHEVSENFILTNDDIYPVNPITLEELLIPRINGDLGDTKYRAGSAYNDRTFHTLELLKAFRLPTKDYATHLPVVYNKEKLAGVITKFGADNFGLLISSLYFNSQEIADPILTKGNASGDHVVYVYRQNPNLDIVQHGFDHRKFVNHNNDGYLPTLPFLEKAFPDKSNFEK